jgi:hypothetical protein
MTKYEIPEDLLMKSLMVTSFISPYFLLATLWPLMTGVGFSSKIKVLWHALYSFIGMQPHGIQRWEGRIWWRNSELRSWRVVVYQPTLSLWKVSPSPRLSIPDSTKLRWEDLLKYLQPLKEFLQEFDRVEFIVRKQQYLEALTWQSAIDPPSGIVPWRPFRHLSEHTTNEREEMTVDMELVVQTLKSLESLCSQRVRSPSVSPPSPYLTAASSYVL